LIRANETSDKPANDVVLSARNVTVEYGGERPTRAVRNVSLDLRRGEVLGIAGESGCGKSTLAFALTRLLRPPGTMIQGSVFFHGLDGSDPVDVIGLDAASLRHFRWNKLSMVFQSAMNSLNPVTSLRRQFSDIFEAHVPEMSSDERDERSRGLLEMVGIDPKRLKGFPHELSGGMRQRVGIAMALALNPEIVVMDEPTTALDVVVQRDILDEINALRKELGFSIIFITHDLPMLVEISDRLIVMYAGEIVERAPSEWVGQSPAHPYTRATGLVSGSVRRAKRAARDPRHTAGSSRAHRGMFVRASMPVRIRPVLNGAPRAHCTSRSSRQRPVGRPDHGPRREPHIDGGRRIVTTAVGGYFPNHRRLAGGMPLA
jgi:peptide/nickel transport system ATP-binding protein